MWNFAFVSEHLVFLMIMAMIFSLFFVVYYILAVISLIYLFELRYTIRAILSIQVYHGAQSYDGQIPGETDDHLQVA